MLTTAAAGRTPMPDDLRTRIAKILYSQNTDQDWNGKEITWEETSKAYRGSWLHDADAVIREIVGITRRCERCRREAPLTDFPPPHTPGGPMRPFCAICTDYVEWSTS